MINWTAEDKLSGLTADLLSEKCNEPFLIALFGLDAGQWVRAELLCGHLEGYGRRIQAAEYKAADAEGVTHAELLVSWQPLAATETLCTISFFVPENMWSTIAIYNQRRIVGSKASDGSTQSPP